ncbi:hypothetical protein M9H77_01942 [Catharanthus roseus]|uniref:Uncharacterized protein n=1 Tax=Catharanthus roseus TaxID=4058 RepID=A0ACC0C746_CATRO|nr:hypothetical protein M9H77_01942 [Catharanthus roseus]
MPLLEAVGMTLTNKNFIVATAFMQNEQDVNAHEPCITNRAKSEHSVLKLLLSTCHGDLDTVFLNIDSLIEGQIADIKSLLEYSRLKEKYNAKSNLILKNVSNNFSHLALKKIWNNVEGEIVDIGLWHTLCSEMNINDGCPLPPLHVQWQYHCNDRVSGWLEPYFDRIADWNTRYARAYPPGDPIHVNL